MPVKEPPIKAETSYMFLFSYPITPPKTKRSPLKINGWKMYFL